MNFFYVISFTRLSSIFYLANLLLPLSFTNLSRIITLCTFLSTTQLEGAITNATELITHDRRQRVFLFGDYHNLFNSNGAEQLAAFVSYLEKADAKKIAFDILVEHANKSVCFNRGTAPTHIFYYLPDVLAEKQLPNTSIKNIEIRTKSTIMYYIFGKGSARDLQAAVNDDTYNEILLQHNKTNMRTLTFAELDEHFEELYVKCCHIRDRWQENEALAERLTKYLAKARSSYEQARKSIAQEGFDSQQRIIDFVFYLFQKWKAEPNWEECEKIEEFKKALEKKLHTGFIYFFDINAVDEILNLKASPNIIVVVGDQHRTTLKKILIGSVYLHRSERGEQPIGKDKNKEEIYRNGKLYPPTCLRLQDFDLLDI